MKLVKTATTLALVALVFACDKTANLNEAKKQEKHFLQLEPSPIGIELIETQAEFVSPPFKSNNQFVIEYELSIVNNYKRSLTLNQIEVLHADIKRTPILTFDKNFLKDHFNLLGNRNELDSISIEPGRKGVATLQMTFEKADDVPKSIFHRLFVGITNKNGNVMDVPFEVAITEIPDPTTITLGLPFNKGKWIYSAESHKDARFITQGKPSYPQRYAIDWAFIEDDGTFVNGDLKKNESYPAYGKELLAVADGVVKEIKDGIPDNIPKQIDLKIDRETICGNYLVLDIGDNTNAVYAHLIPKSFKVKTGDTVKQGQVLGLLGNSGNSDDPHLHFHLETDSPMTLGGEGIPYAFEKYKMLKSFTSEDMNRIFEGKKLELKDVTNDDVRLNEIPIGNGLIEFE